MAWGPPSCSPGLVLARGRSGLTLTLTHTCAPFNPHPLIYFTTLGPTQSIKVTALGRGAGPRRGRQGLCLHS